MVDKKSVVRALVMFDAQGKRVEEFSLTRLEYLALLSLAKRMKRTKARPTK